MRATRISAIAFVAFVVGTPGSATENERTTLDGLASRRQTTVHDGYRTDEQGEDVGEGGISFRLSGLFTTGAPLLRATVAYANDYYDKWERGNFGVSYAFDLAATAGFTDADLFHRYGFSWCHLALDAAAGIPLVVGALTGYDDMMIGGVLAGIVLIAPAALANADINVGWQTVKLSVGWNTDLFVWRQTLLIFQPRVALKLAMPRVVVEGGASWVLATDAALHSGALPRPFASIGVVLGSH